MKIRSLLEAVLSVFCWIAICALTVFWTLPMFLVYLVHCWIDPDRKINHRFAGFWGRSLVAMPGGRIRIFGRENLPKDRPVILMANHLSYSDVPVLFNLRYPFKWMADAPLFRIPFFGWAMWMAGYIPIQRGNPKAGLRSLESAKATLAKGISVFLFPEGTRSRTGELGRFQTGGFRLAAATGTPIVPVVLVGPRELLPRSTWVFRINSRVQIHILPPVASASGSMREVHQFAEQVRWEMAQVYEANLI